MRLIRLTGNRGEDVLVNPEEIVYVTVTRWPDGNQPEGSGIMLRGNIHTLYVKNSPRIIQERVEAAHDKP